MGVTTTPIYAGEAFFSRSFPAKNFQKNYVPFVCRTKAAWLQPFQMAVALTEHAAKHYNSVRRIYTKQDLLAHV